MVLLKRSVFLFLLFASGFAPAQQSLLWQITPPGSNTPSYIFCSTALPGAEKIDIRDAAADILDKVNALAFTSIPSENEWKHLHAMTSDSGAFTLKGYFKRNDRIRFELMLRDKLHVAIEDYYTVKPLYILSQFRDADHAAGLHFQQDQFTALALQKTKPVLSLLTFSQVMDIQGQMDYAAQADDMIYYINHPDLYQQSDLQKFQDYLSQNTVDYAVQQYNTEPGDYINTIIGGMSDALADKINTLSMQQSILYVIDADYVLGEKGILKKLESMGYTESPEFFFLRTQDETSVPAYDSTATAETGVPSDNFPPIITYTNDNPSPLGAVIRNTNSSFTPVPNTLTALSDPYNALFDYDASDTLFLDSWYLLKGADANFSVRVPVKDTWTENSTQTSNGLVKSYQYETNHAKSDLYYSVAYFVYPASFGVQNKADFYNDFVSRSVSKLNGQLVAERVISSPDYTGREFVIQIGDSDFVRSKLFLRQNVLYQLLAGGPGNNAFSVYAEGFFRSFNSGSVIIANWTKFEQPLFSCYLPTYPKATTQTYNTQYGPLQVQSFNATDYRDNVNYFVSVNAYPVGYKFKSRHAFYKDLILNAERQYIGKVTEEKKIKKDKIRGRYIEMQVTDGSEYKICFFFTKNTVFEYLAAGNALALQSLNTKKFFDSFTIQMHE